MHNKLCKCSLRPNDPCKHPNFVAWFNSAQELLASGVSPDDLAPFCGEPVAKVKEKQ